jgi:hypothetical protein
VGAFDMEYKRKPSRFQAQRDMIMFLKYKDKDIATANFIIKVFLKDGNEALTVQRVNELLIQRFQIEASPGDSLKYYGLYVFKHLGGIFLDDMTRPFLEHPIEDMVSTVMTNIFC